MKILGKAVAPLLFLSFSAAACGLGGGADSVATSTPRTTPTPRTTLASTPTSINTSTTNFNIDTTTNPATNPATNTATNGIANLAPFSDFSSDDDFATSTTVKELAPPPEEVPPWRTAYTLTAKPRPAGPDGLDTLPIPVYESPDGLLLHISAEHGGVPVDPTPYGNRLTLLVTNPSAQVGDEWAQVLVSSLPNGLTGWVNTKDFIWGRTNHHITIDLSDDTLTLWEGDELISHTLAITGRPTRPTPIIERTYIYGKVRNTRDSSGKFEYGRAYGTWIFPLAAFSEAVPLFDGSLPQVGIHGTNLPHRLGDEISSGCVRIENEVIDLIADTIPIGTPVSIVA